MVILHPDAAGATAVAALSLERAAAVPSEPDATFRVTALFAPPPGGPIPTPTRPGAGRHNRGLKAIWPAVRVLRRRIARAEAEELRELAAVAPAGGER